MVALTLPERRELALELGPVAVVGDTHFVGLLGLFASIGVHSQFANTSPKIVEWFEDFLLRLYHYLLNKHKQLEMYNGSSVTNS